MSIDFTGVKAVNVPEGAVKKITRKSDGVVLWQKIRELKYYDTKALSEVRFALAATTVGDYALFAGGRNGSSSWSAIVNAYDTALTRTTPTALSEVRSALAATTVGDYALFAGGRNGSSSRSAIVDAYDTVLTRTTPTALSRERSALAATTVGDYALFGGGRITLSSPTTTVDVYTVA